MTTGTTTLERLAGAAQWLAGVAAAALAVMLFTMGDGVNGYGDSGSARGDAETAASETAAVLDSTEGVAAGLAETADTDPEMADSEHLKRGETVYADHCAICHGRSGLGDTAVALAGRMRVAYPDVSDQIAVVADGRGTMPGFLDRLTADEIEAVVAFTRQRL